jgi:DNA-directed RNA polymerase specialized sigma24 family protein
MDRKRILEILAQDYLTLREKLIVFFERRLCPDAADLADDTLARLVGDVERNGFPNSLEARVRAIAKNVYREWARRIQRFDPLPPVLSVPGHGGKAEDAREALAALPPHERVLLEEYYLQRKEREQMARRLGVSAQSLRVRVFRAKKRLQALLWGASGIKD